MKIFRLRLSKSRPAIPQTRKRWIDAAVGTAALADLKMFDRRAARRPLALTGRSPARTRYARPA